MVYLSFIVLIYFVINLELCSLCEKNATQNYYMLEDDTGVPHFNT
jgi:hypothetical protein